MRPTIRLQNIHNWIVNITPKTADSLPYFKMKAVFHKYRQRLLASRTAPVAPTPIPPAALFICRPTPSYVLSPKLAARLKSDVSSLKSNLRVYEFPPSEEALGEDGDMEIRRATEQDCTPEVSVDSDLHDDQALYYGHGQIHLVGMVDMQRADMRLYGQYSSSMDLRDRVAHDEYMSELFEHDEPAANSPEVADSWMIRNTTEGQQKLGRINAVIDRSDDIATVSVTMNLAVPMPGLDPDEMCPHVRLAAAGIESGPFTSILASGGHPASEQTRISGILDREGFITSLLLLAMHRAMGLRNSDIFVDHARALGEADPALEFDEVAEASWPKYERMDERLNEE